MSEYKPTNFRLHGIILLFLCSAVLFLSCVPEFAHPLPADDRQVDNLLFGDWRMFEDNKVWHLSIFSRADGWMDIFLTATGPQADSNSSGTLIYEGYSVPVDSEKYLCVRSLAAIKDSNYIEESDPNWTIVRYTVASDRLDIMYLSAESFQKFITEGKLKGHFEPGPYTGVSVTASSDELKKLFAEECIDTDKDVDMVYERIKTDQ